LVILIILGEYHKLWSSSICSLDTRTQVLKSPATGHDSEPLPSTT
jgi:hypothetical protein